jgi:hypothetical protein
MLQATAQPAFMNYFLKPKKEEKAKTKTHTE